MNASELNISWTAPTVLNGPLPSYNLKHTSPAFNFPPPSVELGIRFSGFTYFMFQPNTIPEGFGFTGTFFY